VTAGPQESKSLYEFLLANKSCLTPATQQIEATDLVEVEEDDPPVQVVRKRADIQKDRQANLDERKAKRMKALATDLPAKEQEAAVAAVAEAAQQYQPAVTEADAKAKGVYEHWLGMTKEKARFHKLAVESGRYMAAASRSKHYNELKQNLEVDIGKAEQAIKEGRQLCIAGDLINMFEAELALLKQSQVKTDEFLEEMKSAVPTSETPTLMDEEDGQGGAGLFFDTPLPALQEPAAAAAMETLQPLDPQAETRGSRGKSDEEDPKELEKKRKSDAKAAMEAAKLAKERERKEKADAKDKAKVHKQIEREEKAAAKKQAKLTKLEQVDDKSGRATPKEGAEPGDELGSDSQPFPSFQGSQAQGVQATTLHEDKVAARQKAEAEKEQARLTKAEAKEAARLERDMSKEGARLAKEDEAKDQCNWSMANAMLGVPCRAEHHNSLEENLQPPSAANVFGDISLLLSARPSHPVSVIFGS
jgi:hypothetical protein